MQKQLLRWFKKNKRELPWRNNSNWYKTFLSEIILQQTTVAQGLPYFQKFYDAYPDIDSLAAASEHDILHMWAGLGYYSRARNMLKAAKIICNEYQCDFPVDYKKALSLPGIGPYSASAILSIAFNKPHAVVDGNVIRVISRLYEIKEDTRNVQTIKKIREHADHLLDRQQPGIFNEALMELGATICTPQQPLCKICPVVDFCKAFKKNLINEIPFKSKPAAKKKKYNIVGIVKNKSGICICLRPASGLLAGMWEFPILETDKVKFQNGSQLQFKKHYNLEAESEFESAAMKQVYSHIDLTFKAFIFKTSLDVIKKNNYVEMRWIKLDEIKNYAFHNAHKKIIKWLEEIKVGFSS